MMDFNNILPRLSKKYIFATTAKQLQDEAAELQFKASCAHCTSMYLEYLYGVEEEAPDNELEQKLKGASDDIKNAICEYMENNFDIDYQDRKNMYEFFGIENPDNEYI